MFAFLSRPYANDAAVGSLIILKTSKPAIFPASLVACLWASLKYAGTVITALVTSWPKYFSAVSFIFCKTNADIWDGEYFFPLASIQASPFSELIILKGDVSISFLTDGSEKFLPINLLTAKIVFSGFVTACLFAGCPISFSSFSVKATTEGVVLAPSAFSKTFACVPSIMETHEFVVPKSIPITLLIIFYIWNSYMCFFKIYKFLYLIFLALFPPFSVVFSIPQLMMVLKVYLLT